MSASSAQSQGDRFNEAAHAFDCDEDEEAFKRSLRRVAKAPIEKKPVKQWQALDHIKIP